MEKVKLGKTNERVSKMCLGTMYFGSRVDKNTSFEMMDYYLEQGGSFLDTSNNYCFWLPGFKGDESEEMIGNWMDARENREDIFLATKCGVRPVEYDSKGNVSKFEGLTKKAVLKAVEGSLKRLNTDFIDLYYMHADWRESPLEETLEAMNTLVEQGKVKNIACSNIDTWRIVKGKEISRKNKWSEFSAVQQWYSYLQPRYQADMWVQRFVSGELLDYVATEQDLTILAYTVALGGIYRWDTIYDMNHPALNNRFFTEENERRLEIVKELAKKYEVSVFQIVFAWIMKHKVTIIPIIAASKLSQLKDNMAALNANLSDEDFDLMNNAGFNQKSYKTNEVYDLMK